MEFETLKRSHLKRNIMIGVAVVLIISAVVLTFTRAKYRVTQSIPLVNGTINYSPFDIKVSTKLLVGEEEYLELDTIPTSSNISLVSSTCTNDAILTWNSEQSRYEIANLTKKGTKCEAVYAVGITQNFDYTGSIQEFIAPEDGDYLLEVWGAQGGNTNEYTGGYGGYSKGVVKLNKNDKLYVAVGSQGSSNCVTESCSGGYNGGGNGGAYLSDNSNYQSGGGGATHISTSNTLLSELENNLNSILIVAGGGSGAYYHPNGAGFSTNGVSGGGYLGNDGIVTDYGMIAGGGGTQNAGGTEGYRGNAGAFGKGGDGITGSTTGGASGGGGGFYGGGAAGHSAPGGGSGYIGNNLLINKAMYCYNCQESKDEDTLTYSITDVSDVAIRNTSKKGNGYAKITQVNYSEYKPKFNLDVKINGKNVIINVNPDRSNLFELNKYYYSINDEFIESKNNTYTFENLDEKEYEAKVYVVDEKNLISEVQYKNISITKGITINDIIVNTGLGTGIPDFSKTSCASGCGETTNGLYTAKDNDGTTYYFRGTIDNNWVKFAGFYWRIIRINGDGTLRLIYNGTTTSTTGEETQIGTSAFNTSYNDNAYVGFKYTIGNVHGTGTSSTILTKLNEWYSTNLSSYANKIDDNAGFCGDRTPSTSSSSTNNQGGTGTTATYYGGYIRLNANKQPTFDCSNEDLYTTRESNDGNKALKYPIGLITADEVAYAGGVNNQNNTNYYLYTEHNYWTVSPSSFSGSPVMFYLNLNGLLNWSVVNLEWGIRPVINLKADTLFEPDGDGTSTNPYVVIGAE